MNAICRSVNPCRIARWAAVVITLSTLLTIAAYAQDQKLGQDQKSASQTPPSATPEALFEDSTLTATTNTINVNYLPIVTGNGSVVYNDVGVAFSVDSSGNLTVSSLTQQPSPRVLIGAFKSGTYLGPDDSTELIQVNGPGIVNGGASEWSLGPAQGAGGILCPNTASWWVGPIQQSPYYARVKAAGAPLTGFYYGTGSANNIGECNSDNDWDQGSQGSLLGFYADGQGGLTISSFTHAGQDMNTVQDTKSYCLLGSKGCAK